MNLRERVAEALSNAVENGYDLRRWAASEVVDDLTSYCSDLEACEPEELLPHVIEWQLKAGR
jgi:hypothetical protein